MLLVQISVQKHILNSKLQNNLNLFLFNNPSYLSGPVTISLWFKASFRGMKKQNT